MKAVRPSDRGPAVEDIQRRLLALGYDLGPTGVDGVFLGATFEAVRSFQEVHRLAEDGIVGDETWSALVDAGFTIGDRMLYLRLPHFHGRDVCTLQEALNVLGFACGAVDGIFGAFTEHAVREFQRNTALPADGIVGPDTVRTLLNLRHVWEGKEALAHSGAHLAAARAAEVLERAPVAVLGDDEPGRRIAKRVVNLAHATTTCALMRLAGEDEEPAPGATVMHVCGTGAARDIPGRPVVNAHDPAALATRLVTALSSLTATGHDLVVELGESGELDEQGEQRMAVILLDAICAAFD